MGRPPSPSVGRRDAWLLWLTAFLVLATGSWVRDLFDADEGRYAAVALGMQRSGDYVVPHLDDMPFMDKPPLVYWVQTPFYALFGPSAFAARMPTLLAGSLWCLFAFLFARRMTGRRETAWTCGLLAATCTAGIIGSRVGPQMDMPLAAAVSGALYAAYLGVIRAGADGRGRLGLTPQLGLGTAVGLGLLIKGPLVVATPFLVAIAWALLGISRRALLRTALSPVAWGTALLIAAPWYVLVERAMPGWIGHFITYEHFGRFSQGDHRSFHPFWFYIPITLIYLAPWTLVAWGRRIEADGTGLLGRLRALFTASPWSVRPWKDALPETEPTGVSNGKLLFAWFLAAFLLYSISTRKLLNYLLPAALPLMVMTGARLQRALDERRRLPWVGPALFAAGALVVGLAVTLEIWLPLAKSALPLAIDGPRWAGMGPRIMVAGGVLAGALIAARFVSASRRLLCLFGGLALFWCLLDLAIAHGSHLGSAKELAKALERHADPSTPVVAYKRYPQGLGFYGARSVWIAGDRDGAFLQREIVARYAKAAHEELPFVTTMDSVWPQWTGKGNVLTTAELTELWRQSPERVVLICRWAEIGHFRRYMPGVRILSGPHAGAGRTDLYVLENRAP